MVSSVVPAGFEAYARVLHPAEEPLHGGDRVVRWAEVAAWSGLPLRPGSQFHSIDLAWTYVGGPAGLIRQLLGETRIEALPAAPDGELGGIEDWVTAQAEQAAGQLLSGGEATVTTSAARCGHR